MTDEDVLAYCDKNRNKRWDLRDIEYINYLLNRFNDFTVDNTYDKCREAVYRLKHNIEKCPICEICGNKLKYLVNAKFYESACSRECKRILSNSKVEQTTYKRYGVRRAAQSNTVKEKQKLTNIQKYGAISPLCNKDIRIKVKNTLISHYGVDNIAKSEHWKKQVEKTSIEKYGTLYPNQAESVREKMKNTLISHYGVDNYYKTEMARKKVKSDESKIKSIQTKRRNNSFNTSKIEIETLNILKEKYSDIIYQYKDKERYPFVCDFYIPSLDLFIECNYHWTHGGKPFEGNAEDYKKLNEWKEKNTKFYDNAIVCWTIRDVKKRNIAKQNNLNYIEIWNINELDLILSYGTKDN